MKKVEAFLIKMANNCISIACTVLVLFSFWVIFVVGLDLSYLIPSIFSDEINRGLNIILLNLSYSYVAGCIFYLFTSHIPKIIQMRIIISGIKVKIGEIDRVVNYLFYAFNRGNAKIEEIDAICKNKEVCTKVLISKDWNSIIEEERKYFNHTITYLSWVCQKHIELKQALTGLIDTYKEYLTAEQLSICEKIRGSFLMYKCEMDISGNVIYSQEAIKATSEDIHEELQKILKLKLSIDKRFCKWDNYEKAAQ